MRRSLVIGAVVAIAAVVLPFAARAAAAPSITLLTPSADAILVGETAITWSYRGFSPSAWVDVEGSRGGAPFERIARVRIDDGTPGYTGSTTWATTPGHDGTDWTIRVVVPSNKWVRSDSVAVVVDNTAPEMAVAERTPANADGWNNGDVTVRWTCTDAASGPVAPDVTVVVGGEGAGLAATATCTDRAGHSTTATEEDIDIDRTAPSAVVNTNITIVPGTTPIHPYGWTAGEASDALSGVATIVVTYVDAASVRTERTATCVHCGTSSAWWTASTAGLAPGPYRITATATDLAGNVGTSAATEHFVVAPPAMPIEEVPTVDADDVTAEAVP